MTNTKYLMGVLIGGPLGNLETGTTGDIGKRGTKGDSARAKDVVNLFISWTVKLIVNF